MNETNRCQCGCGCEAAATTTDDWGASVCEACATTTDAGQVCGRVTANFTRCHRCRQTIRWGPILTGDPGSGAPNHRYGSCACGAHLWREEERGSWGHYSYSAPERR